MTDSKSQVKGITLYATTNGVKHAFGIMSDNIRIFHSALFTTVPKEDHIAHLQALVNVLYVLSKSSQLPTTLRYLNITTDSNSVLKAIKRHLKSCPNKQIPAEVALNEVLGYIRKATGCKLAIKRYEPGGPQNGIIKWCKESLNNR